MICGACNAEYALEACPLCRATIASFSFKQVWRLVHDRLPFRHTPSAQHMLGQLYKAGTGVKQDYAESLKYYELAAAGGNVNAQEQLGWVYHTGKMNTSAGCQCKDHSKAASCSCPNVVCPGYSQDYALAIKWYKCAAAQGSATSACNLGHMFEHGKGVEADVAEAVRWYRQAAAPAYPKVNHLVHRSTYPCNGHPLQVL